MMEKNGSAGSPRRRSVGVTMFGILMLMYSLWFLGALLFDYRELLSESVTFFTPSDLINSQGGWFLPPLVGIIFFISSLGILKFKEWGRRLAVYFSALISLLSVILLLLVFISAFQGETLAVIGILVIIPFSPSIIFLVYLTRPKVKALFSPEQGKTESKGAV